MVEHLTVAQDVVGSSPIYHPTGLLAQLVEQLTLNQWVPGSSPGQPTLTADVVELVDTLDLGSSAKA